MSDITPAPNEALTELFEDSADLIMAPQGAPDSWPDVAYLSMHDMEHPDEGGEWLNSPLDYVGGIQVKSYTDKATSDARIAELEARLRRG